MISNLLSQMKIKFILQVVSISLLCYQISKIIPNMLTLSIGTWMNMAFSIAPYFILIMIIAMWNPSAQKLHLKLNILSLHGAFPALKYLISIFIISILFGFIVVWFLINFPSYTIVGLAVLFSSMILMLVVGAIKPELGPIVFFAAYPFLWFIEGRVNASFYWLFKDLPNIPGWLQSIVIDSSNIHIVMLMFLIGFIIFVINHPKRIKKTILDVPIILLLVWIFLSAIAAYNHFVAFQTFFIKWIFPILFYYATFFTIKRKDGIREIKIALVALLFFGCLLNFQNTLLTGASPWTGESITFSGAERAMRWTIIGYQMGPWMVLIFPLAVSLLFDRIETTRVRLFSFFTIVLGLVMAVWEMQRSVIVTLGLAAVLFFIFYHHRWRQLAIYATIGMIGLFFSDKLVELVHVMRPSLVHGSYLQSFLASPDRLYLFERGLNLVKNNPVFGIGPGGFKLLSLGLYSPEVSSHNMFIEVALESGFIAILLLLIVLFLPIIKAIKSFNNKINNINNIDLRPWTISCLVYCLYLVLMPVWMDGEGVTLFCMLGLLVGSIKKELITSAI